MNGGKPRGADVTRRYEDVLFPNVATYYAEPVAIESGRGVWVTDFDGKKYLDFFGGILTVGIGHGHARVNEAVHAQVDRLGHVSTLYPTLPVVELAERLVRLTPGRLDKVFFCTSGSEADETAAMLAQTYTGRSELVALRHGYSGRSALTQSLVGHARYRAVPTPVAGVKHAHAPYCYRCPFGLTYPACDLRCARDIEELIATTTTGEVAGIVLEPILGVGGVVAPPEGWVRLAVEIVRAHGGVFVCDEVQTGFGRTGAMWGIDHEGVEPDVMTMAKAVANGYPISAVVARAEIAASWRAGNIATFGGNPVSCAAASATIDAIEEEGLVGNAAAMGARLRAGLVALQAKYPRIGDVRGRGLMLGLELVRDEKAGDRTPDPDATVRVFEAAKVRGLLVGRGGLYGNVLRVGPALVVTARQVDDALEVLDAAFADTGG